MKLSLFFDLNEFTFSQTAVRKGIDNTPGVKEVEAMRALCNNVLDRIRVYVSGPVRITSGFRCAKLNKAIGGSANSQHIKGEAADIIVPGMNSKELYSIIKDSGIIYDQLIEEFGRWVHISYNDNPRMESMLAVKIGGKTNYIKDP